MPITDHSPTQLTGFRLSLARITWALFVLLSLGLLFIGTWDKFQAPLPSDCETSVCNPIEFTANDADILRALNFPVRLVAVGMPVANLIFNLGFIVVALFLVWRKSDDWLVLLLSGTLAVLGGVAFSPANDVLYRTRPELAPLVNYLQQPAYISISLLLLIFPDGRFVPRWTRLLALPLGILPIYTFVSASLSIESQPTFNLIVYPAFILLAIYSQVYRYLRVSTPLQQQQTKWGILGIIGAFIAMVGWSLVALALPPEQPDIARAIALLVTWSLLPILGLIMPVSFAIAILRYRLWDIDLIIRRTMQYAVLTGILAVLYFGAIVFLQSIFQRLTGQRGSPMATVISTLAIAVIFNPLRTRLHDFIARRFYRHKYNAAQTLAEFSQTAQHEVDMQRLTEELIHIVNATMKPEHVSIWLRESEPDDVTVLSVND